MNARQRYYKKGSGKSRPGRKRKFAALAAGFVIGGLFVVLVGAGVYKLMGQSDFFQITTIRIIGSERISKRQIMEYSGVDIHSNMMSIDADKVRDNVESGQWIKQADIEKQWPNRLDITVVEYSPVAMVSLKGTLHYVDEKGVVFAEALPPGDLDYPVVTGCSGVMAENLQDEKMLREALRFLEYASGGNRNLPAQNISEINVADPDDVVLFLVDSPFPIHLGVMGKGLRTKYSRLARVLSWLYRKKKFDSTEYINIGYMKDKILVGQTIL